MIFAVIVVILVGVLAYFHYIQGMFSATLSAVCAVFAAVLAFGYHETVVDLLLGGRAADYAHAMVLVVLFAAIYTILRLAFDGFIPGNIQLPLYLDRVGAVVMGLVAGLFCTGVLAVAAQLLPFGPSIAGYSRLNVGGARQVTVALPGSASREEIYVNNEMTDDAIDPAKQKGLLIPVDDLLVWMVGKLSDNGSLAGARALTDVHPDYLLQLFGQRVGIQTGAKRVAFNSAAGQQVSVDGVYRLREAVQTQGEMKQLKDLGLPATIKASGDDELLLVVRTTIDTGSAGDEADRKFRFSLGSVRLNAVDATGRHRNYWPIGTLEDGNTLFVSRPDDFLFMSGGKNKVDLVFRIPSADVLQDPGALRSGQAQIAEGSFLEFKRMGRVALGGQKVAQPPPPSPQVGLQWKKPVLEQRPTGRAGPTAAVVDGPLELRGDPRVVDTLFTPINVGTGDRDNNAIQFGGGTAALVNRQFKAFNIDGSLSITRLAAGEYTVQQLAAPAGQKVVQLLGVPKREQPWEWADVSKFTLEDSAGQSHRVVGAWAKVVVGTAQHFLGAYDAEKGVGDVPQIDGRPTEVTLAFGVPPGVTATALKYDGKVVATFSVPVQ